MAKTPNTKAQTPNFNRCKIVHRFVIGSYTLTRTLNPKAVWLINPIGEAMMTPESRLELAIGRYFRKEF